MRKTVTVKKTKACNRRNKQAHGRNLNVRVAPVIEELEERTVTITGPGITDFHSNDSGYVTPQGDSDPIASSITIEDQQELANMTDPGRAAHDNEDVWSIRETAKRIRKVVGK